MKNEKKSKFNSFLKLNLNYTFGTRIVTDYPKGTFDFSFKLKTNFEKNVDFRFSFHFRKRISNQLLFFVLQMKNENQTQIFGKIFSPTAHSITYIFRHLNA